MGFSFDPNYSQATFMFFSDSLALYQTLEKVLRVKSHNKPIKRASRAVGEKNKKVYLSLYFVTRSFLLKNLLDMAPDDLMHLL